jgi:anthranilate phosphoribosyltransferase
VFEGRKTPARDIVVLNAGAALLVAGRASSVGEGISRAAAAIDSGAASETLDRMVQSSRGEVIA